MDRAPEPSRRTRLATTAALGLGAALVYLVLARDDLYGDGTDILKSASMGRWLPRTPHVLTGPLLFGLAKLLAPLGVTLFESAQLLSAGAGGLGVALFHRASLRVGLAPGRALTSALLVAATPSVVFYATVVEHQSVYIGALGAAAWFAACALARPTAARALAAGAGTALAALAHGTGHLLPLLLATWVLAAPCAGAAGRSLAQRARLAAVVLAGHALVTLLFGAALAAVGSGTGNAGPSVAFLFRENVAPFDLASHLPHSLLFEWTLAHFPLSLATVALLFTRSRRAGAVQLVTALVGVLVAYVVLRKGDEFGAYLLPLVWPAAVLVARIAPPWAAVALVVLAALDPSGRTRAFEDDDRNEELAALVRADADGRPIHIVAVHTEDVELHLVRLPEASATYVQRMISRTARALPAFVHLFDLEIEERLARGEAVYTTASAREVLYSVKGRRHSEGAILFAEHLEQQYARTPLGADAVLAWRLGLPEDTGAGASRSE